MTTPAEKKAGRRWSASEVILGVVCGALVICFIVFCLPLVGGIFVGFEARLFSEGFKGGWEIGSAGLR